VSFDLAVLMPDVIAHNARIHGERTAVVCGDERLTWRDADERTNRFANALRAQGLGKGAKVALFMPASVEAWIAFWGSAKAGCVTVPLNVMLDPESLARLAQDSDAVVVVAGPGTEARLDQVRHRLPSVRPDGWLTFGAGGPGWRDARELTASAAPTPCEVRIEPMDIITILYTSGTTGRPKGIEHTHLSRMAYPVGFGAGLKIDRYSVAVLGTPPYASGTWITMAPTMFAGGTLVILPSFSAEAFLAAVERERGTHAFLVPTQWIALTQQETKPDVSSLRCLVTSGQTLATRTREALEDAFPAAELYEVYGFSEGFSTLRIPEDARQGKVASVGKPALLDDIRVIDEAGRELPPGQTGELVAHSLMMMNGYYKNPALTEATTWLAADGRTFIRSGDMGHLDEDGFVYVSGRLKDMIKSGGINIYAADIEAVFMAHPDVSECAAIAVPDPKWGETPLLVVLPRDGAVVDCESLRTWGNDRLAKYQRVSRLLVRDELPRAVYGKVAKQKLRDEFSGGGTL
jgi:acyl-CoA synthetase (AMP-forming)/AMP-acid ligase II